MESKRLIALSLIVILTFAFSFSGAEDNRFTDVETGISFTIPAGWEEVPNVDNNETIKIQYTPTDSAGQTTFAFAVYDLYSAMSMSQYGVTRKEVDFSLLDDELITAMLGPLEAKSNEVKKYGNYQYKVITTTVERSKAGLHFSFDCEMVITLVDGYVVLFQYLEMNHSDMYHAVFEDVLASVQIE